MLPFPATAGSGSRHPQVRRIAGAVLGVAFTYPLTSRLPVVPSTLLSSLLLAGAAALNGRSLSPLHWWALLGGATGCLLGTAAVLAEKLQQSDPQGGLSVRVLMVTCFALVGCVAGLRLSRDAVDGVGRHPRDLLRSASALTTGIFAVLVTLTYLHSGLDTARTFSSRLSTSLTILVASITVPGWLAHLLDRTGHTDRSRPPDAQN